MKKDWLRPENILLIMPLILRVVVHIHFISYGSIASEDRLELLEQRLWIQTAYDIITWTILFFITWSMHLILRRKGLWRPLPAFAHILLTFFLFSMTVFVNDFAVSVIPGWHMSVYPSSYVGFFTEFDFPTLLLLLVQLFFTIYFTKQVLRPEF
ncbi:MAG: hypothetical protein H7Y31_03455 [Chitinophagaceae bacterium]|nr:hypothetical protein [Chitinophagaceae bacterium]